MKKLYPCPFCGSKEVEIDGDEINTWWGQCKECFCRGPLTQESYEKAVELWGSVHPVNALIDASDTNIFSMEGMTKITRYLREQYGIVRS